MPLVPSPETKFGMPSLVTVTIEGGRMPFVRAEAMAVFVPATPMLVVVTRTLFAAGARPSVKPEATSRTSVPLEPAGRLKDSAAKVA